MRNAIGFLIILWGLSHFFGQSVAQLNDTATASLRTLEVAANVATNNLSK